MKTAPLYKKSPANELTGDQLKRFKRGRLSWLTFLRPTLTAGSLFVFNAL